MRSSSYACRNWCTSQTTLFGWRTTYDGNFVAITRSMRRPSASSRSSEPPEEGLGEDALARIPLERHGDEVGLVPARAQLGDEVVGEDLDAAAGERHLRAADGDSQVVAMIA